MIEGSCNDDYSKLDKSDLYPNCNVVSINEVNPLCSDSKFVHEYDNDDELLKVTNEALKMQTDALMHYDNIKCTETNELEDKIVEYVLSETERSKDGRLIMPIPWNPDCKHLLGTNYMLSKNILFSNLKKLQKNDVLNMYNDVFKEQEQLGVIERIEDVDSFRSEHPECSFLPHMGIVKLNRETTKVRVVYLSNLCERTHESRTTVSHNNAMLPGPCLNNKISTSLLFTRFDKFICIFDIKKAFLNIELKECDQEKLLCLWFKDIENDDFSVIAYKNVRLGFGLRPSPFILMLALHKILELDINDDDENTIKFKKLIYANIYMDNGVFSSENEDNLINYYNKIAGIFRDYKFELQQFASNNVKLQSIVDVDFDTPESDDCVKLLGMYWNKLNDTLSPVPINLNKDANTKRSILSTLNAIYDVFNLYAPLINRARLFFHKIQCDKHLEWDTILNPELIKEWNKICKELDKTPPISLNRYIGSRDSSYDLVAFCDSSALIYGVVLYIVDRETKNVSFVLSKNRVINSSLAKKSIPSLECQGLCFAVETIIDVKNELCGQQCVLPININRLYIYTDSMVALSWVKSYFRSFDKMQKRSIFVQNRLKNIAEVLRDDAVTVRFIEGHDNPADCVTRPFSYNKLSKTNYFTGPSFLPNITEQPDIEVIIPLNNDEKENCNVFTTRLMICHLDDVYDVTNCSSFRKATRIMYNVFKFISILKSKIKGNDFNVSSNDLYSQARYHLIRSEQRKTFPDVFKALVEKPVQSKLPNLILQLNLYIDADSIIRVRGKFRESKLHPILLHNSSHLTEIIVNDLHQKFMHSGPYTVLRELRKKFWILKGFSTVRKILRNCFTCKRVNEKPVNLNQNCYRSFRDDPPKVAFSSVFLDYIGPINIKVNGVSQKVWLLIITCLWSRAVSLQICFTADTQEFLRAVQMHIYEYGMFGSVMSDLGSQITSGMKLIKEFLDDPIVISYFSENNVSKLSFEQYAKGNSALGSVVESLVKQVKSLINKSIGKLLLDYTSFQLLIAKTRHVINRRPVSFNESVRSPDSVDVLDPITPEMLIYSRELLSVNIVPNMHNDVEDYGAVDLSDQMKKLVKANNKLVKTYTTEFLQKLMLQSIDKKDRYKKVIHKEVQVGDVVLLVESNTKRCNYPMGIIKSIERNDLGESTAARVMKGTTRETVYRHITSLIPLGVSSTDDSCIATTDDGNDEAIVDVSPRQTRRAAVKARLQIEDMYEEDLL